MLDQKHRSESTAAPRTPAAPSAYAMRSLCLLALVLFTVSLSASAISPLLPDIVAMASATLPTQERHAAFLNGSYLLAMFVASPAFGYLSDRIGRRPVLLCGITLFTVSLYALSAATSLPELYVSRILSGLGAGGLLPVMLAHVSENTTEERRVRHFACLVSAVLVGGIIGPYLAGLATRPDAWNWLGIALPTRPIVPPVLAGAIASSVALAAMMCILPRQTPARLAITAHPSESRVFPPVALYALFALSVLLMYAVGAFEIGLATLSRQRLKLDAAALGMMYTTCALAMLVMQALFFADPFKDFANRHLLFPAFIVTAIGIALFPLAGNVDQLAWVVTAVAGGAGLIAPVLSYRVSLLANGRQGKSFGLQSASSNLGQVAGSAGSGVLVGLDPQLPYWLAAAILAAAALWILFWIQPHYAPGMVQRARLDSPDTYYKDHICKPVQWKSVDCSRRSALKESRNSCRNYPASTTWR